MSCPFDRLPPLATSAARLGSCRADGGDRRPAGLDRRGARTRKHRRRGRAGDRRRGQHLDLAKGGRAHRQHARSAAGLADGGIFRRILQEPRGGQGDADRAPRAHRYSLGSGFIIDASGLVVTNNHVIADADEINVILNDGTKLPAQLGRQGYEERPRAAARAFRQDAQGGEIRRLRQAAARRMGDRHRQSVQPRWHRDRRHRLGAQPRHQFRAVRQLHPDRRRH